MRLVSFLVMVFGALLSQYLLQTWLVNSEEERRESWDRYDKDYRRVGVIYIWTSVFSLGCFWRESREPFLFPY